MQDWQLTQKNNHWILKLDQSGNGIEIPKVLADRMQTVLAVTNQGDINCHRAVLYLLGQITLEELASDSKLQKETGFDFTFGERSLEISDEKFIPIRNVNELKTFTEQNCKEGLLYVGQILDAETGEAAHSFIVGKELNNSQASSSRFICFDKAGFKFPFDAYEVEKLFQYENYHNQKWRFLLLNNLLKTNIPV